MKLEELKAYEILEDREITDISSRGIRLRHKKTGARVSLLKNDDNNKVFYIAFRTPPTDSTGVAHITEHSVLCGSEKYPVKDPFVELAKGSLNTFLNAMTYPDKTVYPVASCNDKDFQNLMDVYLDAVFHPNTYKNESIFRQEGWHYEFDEEGKLFINGVVYNEMKGAFSSPDDVLSREIMNSLYPDTTYGVESGGDPENIPDLTYDQFLDFHRAYYHPSNSYIYLYGDIDMAEKLDYIDREYLSKYDYREVDSELKNQEAFSEPKYVYKNCNLNEGENPDENTFLSLNYVIEKASDRRLGIALQIIDYCLSGNPGAPLKKALVERGLGKDVYTSFEMGIKQPYFSIISKDTNVSLSEDFKKGVSEVLTDIVEKGIGKKSILAAINHFEFQYREADFGSYPKGLILGLNSLETWLYDDDKNFDAIELLDTFQFLKEQADTDYFENIIAEYLLDNPHSSFVVLEPKEHIEDKKEAELKNKLEAYKNSLTSEQIDKIKDDFTKLNAFQEQVDDPLDLAKLPLLKREDLDKNSKEFSNIILENPVKIIRHDYNTSGITYLRLLFDLEMLPGELYPYASLLKTILAQVNTKNYTYADLNNDIDLVTGGLGVTGAAYSDNTDPDKYKNFFEIKTKFLTGNAKATFDLIEEIIFESLFDDYNRIYDVLAESRSQMQAMLTSAGHIIAINRALAGISLASKVTEELSGVDYYRFLVNILDNYEECKVDLINKLQITIKSIFRKENLLADITGFEECADELLPLINSFADKLYIEDVKKEKYTPELLSGNEALMNAGQVLYVCRAGNFLMHDLKFNGALHVLKTIMGYQYLWVNVRVKGGAYGCMCGFQRSGSCYFVSYRDPNLQKTIDVYEAAPKAVAEMEIDERAMTQYVIGTISEIDQPKNAAAMGSRSLSAYMSNLTFKDIQETRDQIIGVTASDIKELAKYVEAFLSDDRLVVVGNAAKIKEEQKLFTSVSNLF